MLLQDKSLFYELQCSLSKVDEVVYCTSITNIVFSPTVFLCFLYIYFLILSSFVSYFSFFFVGVL